MDLASLSTTFAQLGSIVWHYAILLVAVGVLAMSIVEVLHRAGNTRLHFHRRAVARSIDREVGRWEPAENARYKDAVAAAAQADGRAEAPPAVHEDQYYWVTSQRVYADLLHLCTGCRTEGVNPLAKPTREEASLFGLEIDPMIRQVRSIRDLVLALPHRFPELLRFMAAGAPLERLCGWMAAARAPGAEASLEMRELRLLADHHLDTLRRATHHRWSRLNQQRAMLVGILLTLSILATVFHDRLLEGREVPLSVLAVVLASLPGGFMAPLAKDLLSFLQSLRRRD